MPLPQTLQRIEDDIRRGDLGKARDRLHGLLVTYPNDLSLRQRLGHVYWQLHLPEMAGRYWYLVEHKDEDMRAACARFEAQFRNDPAHLLHALKYKGNVDALGDTYARRMLLDLERRARAKHPWYGLFRERGHAGLRPYPGRQHTTRDELVKWGCIVIAIVLLVLFLTGVVVGAITILGRLA
jgi:hypothetical protein